MTEWKTKVYKLEGEGKVRTRSTYVGIVDLKMVF